jgi:hypothetical protein
MKRGSIIFAIVALLLLADGSYLQVTKDNVGGDTGNLFGNQNINLSAGFVVLVSGGALLVAAVIMWVVAMRRGQLSGEGGQVNQVSRFSQATRASESPTGEAQTEVGVGQGQIGKGRADQRDS